MDLFEYQGKQYFARYDIPVSKGDVAVTVDQAIAAADALLVVTEWADYRAPDLSELKASLAKPIIFDGRNIFDASEMREHGFTYYGIGIN